MNATTIWQLDVYWEDDGPDYDETGREVLHTFEQKPDVNQLRTVLEANNIFAHDSNIAALLDSSGVLMNTHMDCCQLTEVTYSMSRVYRVIGATEDEHCNETYCGMKIKLVPFHRLTASDIGSKISTADREWPV